MSVYAIYSFDLMSDKDVQARQISIHSTQLGESCTNVQKQLIVYAKMVSKLGLH